MNEHLSILVESAAKAIEAAADLVELQQIKAQYLGRQGAITEKMKALGQATPEERRLLGQAINAAKEQIESFIELKIAKLRQAELDEVLAKEKVDVTLPGRGMSLGGLHPVSFVRRRVEDIFMMLGFTVAQGPEVEDEEHNFNALNIPEHHPARESFDTFYFPDGRLLRTHTSPVQIRVMKSQSPPLRIIAPGRVYRCDSDATHSPMFNQVEGLVIDEQMSFSHLKGLLHLFLKTFFDREVDIRLRPSYFPFTEPSAEVDMRWGEDRWLEILGCGMVHPTVLKKAGIDSEKYTGFAFGMGLDRLAMLYFGISDLRILFENDLRLLEQFE